MLREEKNSERLHGLVNALTLTVSILIACIECVWNGSRMFVGMASHMRSRILAMVEHISSIGSPENLNQTCIRSIFRL